MPKQDIIVVGASAGGIEAMKVFVAGLPADLPAAVFVVIHIGNGNRGQSILPEILSGAGPLRAVKAEDGARIRQGMIYVAPPDRHLLLKSEGIRLSHGPKENRTRPAIDPLFRSAAVAYGRRVTGVILTGMLDDGVAGLAEIKRRGGVAVVEDPNTALFPSMPLEAVLRVQADFIASLPEIPAIVADLARTERDSDEREESMEKFASLLTCPECRGPLTKESQGKIVQFSCRVGHRYTPLAMYRDHQDTVERSLWASVVALEEAADIAETLADELGERTPEEVRKKRGQAAVLREMLNLTDAKEAEEAAQFASRL